MTEHTETTETPDDAAEEFRHGHHYGPCGPWGGMHPKMMMFARMAKHGFGGHFGRSSRGGRAQRWMYENPSDAEIIGFLEEYQRDLEQQVEDVRTRIEEIRSRSGK